MKAKRNLRRLISLLTCLALCLSMIPTAAFAASTMQNVHISESGVLSWDAVEGAAQYQVIIGSGGASVTETSWNLKEGCASFGFATGEYDIALYAQNVSGGRITERWTGTYSYISELTKLATPSNIRLEGDTIKWDAVEHAEVYSILVKKDGSYHGSAYRTADRQIICPLDVGSTYSFEVGAEAVGYEDSDYGVSLSYTIDADATMQNVSLVNGGDVTMTGADKVGKGTTYTCTILPMSGYTLESNQITVKCNGIDVDKANWSYDNTSGILTVAAIAVNGNLEIYASGKAIPQYTVSFENGGSVTFTGADQVTRGTAYSCNLLPATGYTLESNRITVKCDGIDVDRANWSYDTASGVLTIAATAVIGRIAIWAEATDSRIKVSTITATSDTDSIPTYGGVVKAPTFIVTEGSPTYFNTSNMGDWQKKESTGWEDYEASTFTEGIYRYRVQIRIDGTSGTVYVLDKDGITVTVDGKKWADKSNAGVGDNYSWDWVYSGEYEVKAPAGTPLDFIKQSDWNIGMSYLGKEITQFSVAGGATGGTAPYTFSKLSGPEWLTVSADGIISGTPKAAGENANLVVRVTDSASATKEITLTVADTAIDPANRTKISTITATSDTDSIPTYGGVVKVPTFIVTEGSPTYFSTTWSGDWQKKESTGWEDYEASTFTEGIYRYRVQVRIDGTDGTVYVLDKDGITVTVDGRKWADKSNAGVGDNYSWDWVYSGEYIVSAPSKSYTLTFHMNGHGTAPAAQTVASGKTASRPANPDVSGWIFEGWYTDSALSEKFDFSEPILRDTTVYAKWTEISETVKFVDVKTDDYFYKPVLWAAKEGITSGTDATHFSPYASCIRAQMVTFLWRAAGSPEPASDVCPFTDVKSGEYYYKAVLWAVEKGITTGTSATTFSPEETCTRAQTVTFLYRFEGKPSFTAKNIFTDVKSGVYYYDAVLWAIENGITNGTSATTFSPEETCTRAQIVTFLYRDLVK